MFMIPELKCIVFHPLPLSYVPKGQVSKIAEILS